MNQKVKDALSKVTERLKSLSKEDFAQKMSRHATGEIASALMEGYEFSKLFDAMGLLKQASLKIHNPQPSRQEIRYVVFDKSMAANDDYFMMAA